MTITYRQTLLAATALAMAGSTPAWAQNTESDAAASANDIIVTAQRMEQRLQDVPISITVFDQAKLDKANVSSLRDLASYTPGLAVNNRYGGDNTTFTIRGFYQEQRSFATVGVFFADVVAPRGSGATFGGDGAGPGALFDLQNVQVLKGPQGTLFGRNVTGGAVLLVPKKPTDKFEGYVEGGLGDYDLKRIQAVINVPVSDDLRLRFGLDHMDRHGYLKNIGNFGDGKFGNRGMGDTDYWAGRVSAVWDVAPDIENYTIFTYTHSQSNGLIPKITAAFPCGPGVTAPCPTSSNQAFFGNESVAQMAREAPYGFWTVSNRLPDSEAVADQWQVINTLTWTASDSLTVKNILSYGEFKGKTNLDLFGNYSLLPGVVSGTETGLQVRGFAFTHNNALTGKTNAERSMVGELQFQGHPGDGAFTWQAGVYAEISDPLGISGVQTASFTGCADVPTFNCLPSSGLGGPPFPAGTGAGGISGGTGSYSLQKTKFRDYAAYAQASYKLTDQLTLTGGIRYTWDKMHTFLINETAVFMTTPSDVRFGCTNLTAPGFTGIPTPTVAGAATYPYTFADRLNHCQQNLSKNTKAPTWLLQADYKVADSAMIYGKWSRGYRQGGLAIFGPDPLQSYGKETVDTYEVGAKTSWRGAMPGSFNIAGYYNNLKNQQLQLGVACSSAFPATFTVICSGNATIINAGKSRIWGIEADANISPFEGLRLDLAYGYINARQLKVDVPTVLPPYNAFTAPLVNSGGKQCAGEQCNTIANSGPPQQVVGSANYTLPLDESIGKITVGGTVAYQSRRRIVSDGVIKRANGTLLALAQTAADGVVTTSGAGIAPASTVLNLNASWENIANMPVDLSFFITNVTNEHVILQINDNQQRGFISSIVGEPRMWGVRAKYRFGQ